MDYVVGESDATTYTAPTLPQLISPEDVNRVCRPMAKYRQEVFRVLLLNQRNYLMGKHTVSKGTISMTLVHPREVFRPALVQSAANIVVVHNHPSGDAEPSSDDIQTTRRLVAAGKLLGVNVLDHVIVVRGGFLSFKQRRLVGM